MASTRPSCSVPVRRKCFANSASVLLLKKLRSKASALSNSSASSCVVARAHAGRDCARKGHACKNQCPAHKEHCHAAFQLGI